MNNDFLRVNSKQNEDGVINSQMGTTDCGSTPSADNKQKITLFTLLRRRDRLQAQDFAIPEIKGLFSIFAVFMSFMLSMYFTAIVSSSIPFLLLAIFVTSFALPLCSIMFFFKLNTMHNVKLGEICMGVAVGALFFCIYQICYNALKTGFIFNNVVLNILPTVISDFFLFFIAFAFAKFSKKDCIFGTALLVVSVYAGYIISYLFTELSNGIFVSIRTEAHTEVSAILIGEEYFVTMLTSFIPVLLRQGFLISTLMCLWSAISGILISVMVSPVKNNSYSDVSVYSILVATIFMHVLSTVNYATLGLGYVVIIAVLIITIIITIKLLNYSLLRTNFSNSKQDD